MTRAVWLDVGDHDLREYLTFFFRIVGWSVSTRPAGAALMLRGSAGRLVLSRGGERVLLYGPLTPDRLVRECARLLRVRRAS